jgi:hypothetical protein
MGQYNAPRAQQPVVRRGEMGTQAGEEGGMEVTSGAGGEGSAALRQPPLTRSVTPESMPSLSTVPSPSSPLPTRYQNTIITPFPPTLRAPPQIPNFLSADELDEEVRYETYHDPYLGGLNVNLRSNTTMDRRGGVGEEEIARRAQEACIGRFGAGEDGGREGEEEDGDGRDRGSG